MTTAAPAPRDTSTDVLVVGGGLGGVAAALAAVEAGARVILTEESAWLGGQLTSQLVPPDEHPWIESFGASARYRALRTGIRDYYRRHHPLLPQSRAHRTLNPGAGWVSALCHEPRVAVAVLDAMLAPWRSRGRLVVLDHHEPVAADVAGDHVRGVVFRDRRDGLRREVAAKLVLDATETGELLPLAGVEYVTGAEARDDTGEPTAPPTAQPLNMQAVTVCFAMEHRAGEDHTSDEPADYRHWRSFQPEYWPGPMLGWTAPHPHTLEPRRYTMRPNPDDDPVAGPSDPVLPDGSCDLWTYRRIIARRHYPDGTYDSDVTVVNWPMVDYVGGPLFEVEPTEAARHAAAARQLSLSFFHWLQTEAPRPDGGVGWPGLRLRPDIAGTADGLAMRPYIRESRRILAQYRVVEQDLSAQIRGDAGARDYPDAVGIGAYRVDLHPSTGGDNYIDFASWPFQVPLRSLVPRRVRNLVAAGKNIGTTHITTGCYRLHPVEWVIGEAAGTLAAYCVATKTEPQQVTATPRLLGDLRDRLAASGVELAWPRISPL